MEFDFHLAFVLYLRLILHFSLKSYFFFDKTKQRKKINENIYKINRALEKLKCQNKIMH